MPAVSIFLFWSTDFIFILKTPNKATEALIVEQLFRTASEFQYFVWIACRSVDRKFKSYLPTWDRRFLEPEVLLICTSLQIKSTEFNFMKFIFSGKVFN